MVDPVDSFLNNAVDLYVQTVDYCRILTSPIPTPVSAGIQQIKPESGDVRQMSPESGENGRIPATFAGICICQILKNNFILFFINIFYFVNKI
jgi:hypothetical protein